MTAYASLEYFLWSAVCLIPVILLVLLRNPVKYVLLLASLVTCYLMFADSKRALLSFALYVVYQTALVRLYSRSRRSGGPSSARYGLALALAILPLLAVKLPLSGIPYVGMFGFMGISYLTFRTVQVVIDCYDGRLEDVRILDFLSFLCFFPAVTSGPIDRFQRFLSDADDRLSAEVYLERVGRGLQKILLGLVYKFTISMWIYKQLELVASGTGLWNELVYAYVYGFYLFFDFAGYSLMAVGSAYCLGIVLPDNFSYPFISVDIKDFWNRWHISLSHWFRDYVFNRFVFRAIRHKRFKSRQMTAAAGFMVNMGIMGLWHGLSLHYFLYGLYHGLLLAGTELYQKKSNFHKTHKKQTWYKLLSWFVTLNLVMLGFWIFSGRRIPF